LGEINPSFKPSSPQIKELPKWEIFPKRKLKRDPGSLKIWGNLLKPGPN